MDHDQRRRIMRLITGGPPLAAVPDPEPDTAGGPLTMSKPRLEVGGGTVADLVTVLTTAAGALDLDVDRGELAALRGLCRHLASQGVEPVAALLLVLSMTGAQLLADRAYVAEVPYEHALDVLAAGVLEGLGGDDGDAAAT